MSTQFLPENEVKSIWQQVCNDLQTQLTPAVFNTWVLSNPLTHIQTSDDGLKAFGTITCPTAFHATNLKKNLYAQLKSSLEKYIQLPTEIEFRVGEVISTTGFKNAIPQSSHKKLGILTPTQPTETIPATTHSFTSPPVSNSFVGLSENQSVSPTVSELFSAHSLQISSEERALFKARKIGLRLDYTFKAFAVSTSNEMAHAAAVAVSNNPGGAYNPLFLYGGVGVGKTHLMHSIGHNILQKNPEANIIYCTGEEFTNEIVSAIQSKKALNFKSKFRNTQVLMIDDIQFIAGKNAVQEEFFHTFNALIKQASQVILTSDRPPHEINLLEDRLRSRFEAGLMIDIQQPSFELRTAILLIKAQANQIAIPMELAQVIASKVDSARKIEGIIKQIKSEVELKNRQITPELIDELLRFEVIKKRPAIRVSPDDIIKTVANHFRVKQAAIKGKKRTKDLVIARHVAMYFLREELKMPLEEIGKWFSNRDHTSVIHATQKVEELLTDSELIKQDVSALRMSLTAISR